MSEDKRLVEIMAELLAEVHEMRVDMNARFGSLERQQQITNLEIKELRLSVMRLADEMGNYKELDQRLKIVEDKLLH